MGSAYRRFAQCRCCRERKLIQGRGLCSGCYARAHRTGTLDEWPMVATNKDHGDGAPLEGLTYRQVDYWVRRGYLRPAFAKPGSGSARCWSQRERAIAAMMRRLILAGLSVEAAHRVARSGESKIELGRDVWLIVEEESTPAEYAERQLRLSRERQAGLDYERIERARAAQSAKSNT